MPAELHVMTFNLRVATDEPSHTWLERRPVMKRLLLGERPDVIGTQEGIDQQLREIATDLPAGYDSIGEGREGEGRGESMQVFFDSRRLEPLQVGHYWLSDTPEIAGSKTWPGCCPRMVTWIRFGDRSTRGQFYVLNTHLEAFSAEARTRSVDLILERLKPFDQTLPVLMTGDFNEPARPGAAVYDKLVGSGAVVDSWQAAATRGPLVATFHGYGPPVPGGDRIDWILTSPHVTTRASAINTYAEGECFPSDHFPVQAVVELP
jgi:endonuclease/exonuclease/phosphatase family metal-dependent hydrolase